MYLFSASQRRYILFTLANGDPVVLNAQSGEMIDRLSVQPLKNVVYAMEMEFDPVSGWFHMVIVNAQRKSYLVAGRISESDPPKLQLKQTIQTEDVPEIFAATVYDRSPRLTFQIVKTGNTVYYFHPSGGVYKNETLGIPIDAARIDRTRLCVLLNDSAEIWDVDEEGTSIHTRTIDLPSPLREDALILEWIGRNPVNGYNNNLIRSSRFIIDPAYFWSTPGPGVQTGFWSRFFQRRRYYQGQAL